MKEWLKANWFRIGILLLATAAVAVFARRELRPQPRPEPTSPAPIVRVLPATSTLDLIERYDLSVIVTDWYPRMAQVECSFTDETGESFSQRGSGFLRRNDGALRAYTNRHLVVDAGDRLADGCSVILPNHAVSHFVGLIEATSSVRLATSTFDWAYLRISRPTQEFLDASAEPFRVCETRAAIGESVIILGYPSIGAIGDVTVTQGIISGYDGEYYITDAKISYGNSGGAAILVKRNPKESCFLGIPTFAEVGEVEALGRILDARWVDFR